LFDPDQGNGNPFRSRYAGSNGIAIMHLTLLSPVGMLLLTACVAQPLPTTVRSSSQAIETASDVVRSTPTDVSRDAALLQAALQREVPHSISDSPDKDAEWLKRAQATIAATGYSIDQPQLLVVVDRSPAVQQMRIVLAQPGAPWQVIGGTKVSTGQAGRRGYFITPIGVFLHTDAIVDYRALGTFNENHIRGLGLKGMRVWDFGWQQADRGWVADADPADIRLLMHATDPDYLEQRLGRPASQGCVRIPAAMNRFLDAHGVLDLDHERAARDDPRFAAVLLPGRQPTRLAGRALVIIDSRLQEP
jgi:hypothetical protein